MALALPVKSDEHEVLQEGHEAEGDEQGGELPFPGDLPEEGLVEADPEDEGRGHDDDDRDVGVDAPEAGRARSSRTRPG